MKCHRRVCRGILHSFCCFFSLGGAVKDLSWSHFMPFPSCAQRSALWSTFLLQTSVCLALFILSSTLTNLKIEALKNMSILGCFCHASLFLCFTIRKALDRRWAVETASFVSMHCHDPHVFVELLNYQGLNTLQRMFLMAVWSAIAQGLNTYNTI